MRNLLFAAVLLLTVGVQAQNLDYYLPKNVRYNPAIPTPASVIGHEVGEWHVTHDRLVNYMKAVDAASDRVTLQQLGTTYEGRPQSSEFRTNTSTASAIDANQSIRESQYQ